jgi:hypothetical protein
MASLMKTRNEIREEIVRLVLQDPYRSQEDELPPIGEPFHLQSPDEYGTNWTLDMSSTAHEVPTVRKAITAVKKLGWNIKD